MLDMNMTDLIKWMTSIEHQNTSNKLKIYLCLRLLYTYIII